MKPSRRLLTTGLLALHTSLAQANGVIMINEIMYHPADPSEELEFIEVHNTLSYSMDLSDWTLDGDITYSFPAGTIIPADGLIAIAKKPSALQSATGSTGYLGPFTGQLPNAGATIELKNKGGRLMDEVSYQMSDQWPTGPSGSGASLAKKTTFTASSNPANWHTSPIGGPPGQPNFPNGEPHSSELLFNEIPGTTEPLWIELINPSSQTLDPTGYLISVAADPARQPPPH